MKKKNELFEPDLPTIEYEAPVAQVTQNIEEAIGRLLDVASDINQIIRQLPRFQTQTPPNNKTIYEVLTPEINERLISITMKLGQATESLQFIGI